jgi:hypothetical protein
MSLRSVCFAKFPLKVVLLFVIFMSCQSTASRTGAPRPGQGGFKEAFVAKLSEFDACQGIDQQAIYDLQSQVDQCDSYVESPVEIDSSSSETPVQSGFYLHKAGGIPRALSECYKWICGWVKKNPEPKRVDAPSRTDGPSKAPGTADDTSTLVPTASGQKTPRGTVEEIFKEGGESILEELKPYAKAADDLPMSRVKFCSIPKNCDPSKDDFSCTEPENLTALECLQRMNHALSCGATILQKVRSGRCTHFRLGDLVIFYGALLFGHSVDYAECALCAAPLLPSNN